MSYTRRYDESVSGERTVRISYPPSENGGSVSETVSITIPVSIRIHVDTTPFDREIRTCETGLDALTVSVMATEAAQIDAIESNAQKVSDQVTTGFFELIRSEITQQATEYRSATEALAGKLSDMRAACVAKVDQMRQDYERITQRYSRIFDDLDSEITTRVGAVDSAAFSAHREMNIVSNRTTDGTLSTTATIGAAESLGLRSLVATGGVRHRARQVLKAAHDFVMSDRRLAMTIQRLLRQASVTGNSPVHLPVLYRRSEGPDGAREDVFIPTTTSSPIVASTFTNDFRTWFGREERVWRDANSDDARQINLYFDRLVNGMGADDDVHRARVGTLTLQLWHNNADPQTL
jgi:hypothetical protein